MEHSEHPQQAAAESLEMDEDQKREETHIVDSPAVRSEHPQQAAAESLEMDEDQKREETHIVDSPAVHSEHPQQVAAESLEMGVDQKREETHIVDIPAVHSEHPQQAAAESLEMDEDQKREETHIVDSPAVHSEHPQQAAAESLEMGVDQKREATHIVDIPAVHSEHPQQAAAESLEMDEDQKREETHIVDSPAVDLEQVASQYSGLARVNRLMFFAQQCPSLRVEALQRALKYVMLTSNTRLYNDIYNYLLEACVGKRPEASSGIDLDIDWMNTTNDKVALKLQMLNANVDKHKEGREEECIRQAYVDLGDYHFECGRLMLALHSYSGAQFNCPFGVHRVNLYLRDVRVNVHLNRWPQVQNEVRRTEAVLKHKKVKWPCKGFIQSTQNELNCALGIALLSLRKYNMAAKSFMQVKFEGFDFPEMLSPSHLAIYAVLCALASFDRQELKDMLSHSSFKYFLELQPQVRDGLENFCQLRYSQCLAMLDSLRDTWLLDMYLAPLLTHLYTLIRHRALIQYFSPYMSADMHKMASAFNTPVEALQDELMNLILTDKINARIDSQAKVLYARDVDHRISAFKKALECGRQYLQKSRTLLLLAAVVRTGIMVKGKYLDKLMQLGLNKQHSVEYKH